MPKNIKTQLTTEQKTQLEAILATAEQQMDSMSVVMPEGKEGVKRFPGLNPKGHYSEVDMEFDERMKRCENASRMRNPLCWELYQDVKGKIEASTGYKDMKKEIMDISQRIRTIDRALRLCKDETLVQALEEKKEELKNSPVIKDMDMCLKTLEYYSGARLFDVSMIGKQEKFQEEYSMTSFCKDKFNIKVSGEIGYDPFVGMLQFSNPKNLEIEFENLDDVMMHQRMMNDKNLGKTWEEIENTPLERSEFENYASSVPAYVQASCDRVLDSALPKAKDRADFIFIDGVSVRERMKKEREFKEKEPSEEEIKKYSSLYVAEALRNGGYVETFTRDLKDGNKINHKPVTITAKGENSYILKKSGEKEIENITVGFLDRFLAKLGISRYKEKVKHADMAQTIKQSRENFRKARGNEMKAALSKEEMENKKKAFEAVHKYKDRFLEVHEKNMNYGIPVSILDKQFFPNGKQLIKNKETGYVVPHEREQMRMLCIAEMLKNGYTLEQVLDTSKHVADRAEMAQKMAKEIENCDQKRLYEIHLETADITKAAMEKYAKDHNISFKDPESIYGDPAAYLLDMATGVGNIVDFFTTNDNKEVVEQLFGKEFRNQVYERSDAAITIGMLHTTRRTIPSTYTKLAEGNLINEEDFIKSVKSELLFKVFAKYEEITGNRFSPLSNYNEMESLTTMVMAHPDVENFYKNSTPEQLIDAVTKGNVLEQLNMEIEFLPEKKMPGKDIISNTFLCELPMGSPTANMSLVPSFNGKSDFYEMDDPEVVQERAEMAL